MSSPLKAKNFLVQCGDRGGYTHNLVVVEGKAVETKQSIDKEENGKGQALIASSSNLLTNIVGCRVYIHQIDVEWSKQGAGGAVNGVLGDIVGKSSEGWLGRRRHGHD
jgi:hypothetical protein